MPEHHQQHDHHVVFDSPEVAAFAEREGEVLAGLVTEAARMLAGLRPDTSRVIDIGCGPGVGTCILARQFGSATVVAADGSAAMLERAAARAERLGLADRVGTRLVELPGGLDGLGPADIVWASMVLHHVGDEATALVRLREVVAPGGLLALAEKGRPLRVLPDGVDLGRPGLWERLDAAWEAWFAGMRAELAGSVPSGDYAAMLAGAGFDVVVDRVLTTAHEAPLDEPVRRVAHEWVVRMQTQLEHHADPADLDALAALTDEHHEDGLLRRPDAVIRASRHLYVARAAG